MSYKEDMKNELLKRSRKEKQVGGLEVNINEWIFMIDNGGELLSENIIISDGYYLHKLIYCREIFKYLTTGEIISKTRNN